MRIGTLLYLYSRRLRTHPVQEALAGLGIAVGVALVFAVQVANSSITAGSNQIVKSITGPASLQIASRSPDGFDERLLSRVARLPGVKRAAPVLDLSGSLVGPGGRTLPVQIASASATLAILDGLGKRLPFGRLSTEGVMLPQAAAEALGISTKISSAISTAAPVVSLRVRGRSVPVKVSAVLGSATVGALSGAMVAIAPLELVQRIAKMPRRVSRILVEPAPGRSKQVREGLARLAAGRLTVSAATNDLKLLRQATIPNGQATSFFAFVSALVGALLAFNAMLLSVPERRRVIADLRLQGTRPADLVKMLLFQALCLGFVASAIGVIVGDVLSRTVFHQTPGYLAAAFPLGSQTVVGWQPLVISLLGGVTVTCLAAISPLLDLRRSRAIDAVNREAGEPGHGIARHTQVKMFAVAVLLVAVTSGVLLVDPSAVISATLALALATLLAIPLAFAGLVAVAQALARRSGKMNMLLVAVRASRATTLRSLALAATGAIAVFGTVVAQGSHRDLLNGLYGDYAQYVSTADLWVTNRGDELATSSFPAGRLPQRIARIHGVTQVRRYQGQFLDVAGRRTWLIARSSSVGTIVPPSQVVEGEPKRVQRLLRAGGWVTLSRQLSEALGAKLGGRVSIPTPSGPVAYRVAAITTNLGWTSGAIILDDADYRRAWGTSEPTALEVDVGNGASLATVQRGIAAMIAPDGGLRVQSSGQRASQADALARQGLSRLTQISLLLTIAAALAMASAMGASIWQRRPALASLRMQSFQPSQLRVVLLWECAIVLLTGCTIGLATGVYGHSLSDEFLRLTTGFPAPFTLEPGQMAQTLAVVVLASLAVLIPPGYVASTTPPALALQE